MTHAISAAWSEKMLALDEHVTPGAGPLAARPMVAPDAISLRADETRLAFGRFVNVVRRGRRLSIEDLADRTKLEVAELLNIEGNPHHEPDLHAVWSLSKVFGVPQSQLMELAGLATAKESHWLDEVVRHAARSTPIEDLTPEEQHFHDAVVAALKAKAT